MKKYIILTIFFLYNIIYGYAAEPKTIITGDQMEIIKGGDVVVFTGNSKISQGQSVINADKLIQDKKNKTVKASGSIKFKTFNKEKDMITGSAEKAVYNTENCTGQLYGGRPEIKYFIKSSTEQIHILADNISFNEKKEEIQASGKVVIVSSSTTAYSSFALFNQKNNTVILTGKEEQPYVIYYKNSEDRSRYSADKILVYIKKQKVIFEGNVHGNLISKEIDKNIME